MNHKRAVAPDQEFRRYCRQNRLRATPQRLAVYMELKRAKDHPCIETVTNRVRRRMPTVSFDTVYRTLLSLADLGLVDVVEGFGGSKRFDGDLSAHHHFRCTRCQRIEDFASDYYSAVEVPEDVREQFHVSRQRILLEGLCRRCFEKKSASGKKKAVKPDEPAKEQ